jgi:putative transposase
MIQPPVSYKRHGFPPQIIAHAVWLYFRFPLSLRLVEEMLLERWIVLSYETIRRWTMKFGPDHCPPPERKMPGRRDTKAAGRLLKRLLYKQGSRPRRMVTDKLGSYAAARRKFMPSVERRAPSLPIDQG